MDYARAIRVARSAKDLTQQELGKRIGKDSSFISRIESGNRVPSLETMEAIAKALSIPQYLLVFLASEGEDLTGLTTDQAHLLGQSLLGLFRLEERAK